MAPNFLEIVGFITCFAGVIVGIVYICKFGCWLYEFNERHKLLRAEFYAHNEDRFKHVDQHQHQELKMRIDKLERDYAKHNPD